MKRKKILVSLSAIAMTTLIAGCTAGTDSAKSNTTDQTTEKVDVNTLDLPQLSNDIAENEVAADIVTSLGTISVKLFPEQAPKAVENFMTHARDGYYNDVKFHRVIKDFMIQTGDPRGTGMGGESIFGEEFAPEISNQLYHINGALAMARTGGPVTDKTQGSQFYIVQNDQDVSGQLSKGNVNYPDKIKEAYKKGGTPFLDAEYSVFGQVISGLDIVKQIGELETVAQDAPAKDFRIEKINIIKDLPETK
ncbi:peptidylprolyl isomerase [Vagococcus coleopterorum]|uniref:Peptidyl-prolyl cis-trans isomerase n=1 Tax=Vagococcus coleopterorum TaxID=2714946 RepID=A0A6G8ANG0_9ENTE|nr:peptidylprolyl isomerase [Vagococcus coleopterorum]QIL46463.1 peptidylprolyl isomerase [Vagococcus coleopterorum]